MMAVVFFTAHEKGFKFHAQGPKLNWRIFLLYMYIWAKYWLLRTLMCSWTPPPFMYPFLAVLKFSFSWDTSFYEISAFLCWKHQQITQTLT